MSSKIKIKRSNTAGKVPATTDLEVGELAVNLADRKLYSKEPGGTVVQINDNSIVSDPPAGTSQVIEVADPADTSLTLKAHARQTANLLIANGNDIIDKDGDLVLDAGQYVGPPPPPPSLPPSPPPIPPVGGGGTSTKLPVFDDKVSVNPGYVVGDKVCHSGQAYECTKNTKGMAFSPPIGVMFGNWKTITDPC